MPIAALTELSTQSPLRQTADTTFSEVQPTPRCTVLTTVPTRLDIDSTDANCRRTREVNSIAYFRIWNFNPLNFYSQALFSKYLVYQRLCGMMIGAIFEPKKFYLHIACLHLQLDA